MKQALFYLFIGLLGMTANAQKDSIVQKRIAKSLLRQGNTLYDAGKFTEAGILFQKASDQIKTYYKGGYNSGNALYRQQKYKEAIAQLELAASSTEDKFEKAAAYHNIGNAELAQKSYGKAIEAYKKSLRNNPADEQSRYNLAYARKMQEQKQDDEDNKNQPPPSEYAKRMKKKADGLLESYDFEEALQVLESALDKDPTVANYKEFMDKIESVIEIKKQ